ncbi:MAG: ThiF family adenylyltransferase [Mangrovibacterium sp.]
MDKRYCRNRIYVREDEQKLIQSFRIFITGAGIGSIIAECALRFGFENITIVDGDKVELSNLNRQNYEETDLGKPKVEALAKRLLRINSQANIKFLNSFIDANNVSGLLKGHDVAVNALDFSSDIPFLFDEWCKKYAIPVIHPYNIGWGGLVTVVEPNGPQLQDISKRAKDFEVQMVEYVCNYFKFWTTPQSWIEKILTEYKNENGILPPPQLSIASWIVGGLCTNVIFHIATGKQIKRFPKFYLSSILDDRN